MAYIAMFVAWQPLNNSEQEDKEHRLEIPICILVLVYCNFLLHLMSKPDGQGSEGLRMGTYCTDATSFLSTARKTRKKCSVIYLFKHPCQLWVTQRCIQIEYHTRKLLRHYRKEIVWKSKEWLTDVVERLNS